MENKPLTEIYCKDCNKVQTWTGQVNCKSCGKRLSNWSVATQLRKDAEDRVIDPSRFDRR